MAISKSGHLGPSSGKIGNVVFYMLNGQQVSRSIGLPGKPTKAQLANRQAMKVTMNLLRPMLEFIKPGFELKAKGTTCNSFNLATSYNKKHALKGEYPNISVDYSKVLLSSGSLPSTEKTSLVKTKEGLNIKWAAAKAAAGAFNDDIVMVVLRFPSGDYSKSYLNAAKREDGKCFIPVPDKELLNGPIEAYMCFKSADGERISDSVYLGNLNGSAEEQKETERKEKERAGYQAIESRFKKVKASYDQFFGEHGLTKSTKAFKYVAEEYEVLKNKLKNHPGKPG